MTKTLILSFDLIYEGARSASPHKHDLLEFVGCDVSSAIGERGFSCEPNFDYVPAFVFFNRELAVEKVM